jgi:hypothetical protein
VDIDLAPPETAGAYQDYRDEIEQRFPGVYKLLDVYYALPEGGAKDAYAAKHPEIEAYNTFRDQYLAQHPDIIPYVIGADNKLAGASPDIQALVYQYRSQQERTFPDAYALQDQYYALPPGAPRRAFLQQNPQLAGYWEWRRQFMAQFPNTIPYLYSVEGLAEKVLGEDYQTPKEPYQAYIPTTQDILRYLDPATRRQLMGYVYAGQELGSGALRALRRAWDAAGQPRGDFEDWLENELLVAVR